MLVRNSFVQLDFHNGGSALFLSLILSHLNKLFICSGKCNINERMCRWIGDFLTYRTMQVRHGKIIYNMFSIENTCGNFTYQIMKIPVYGSSTQFYFPFQFHLKLLSTNTSLMLNSLPCSHIILIYRCSNTFINITLS